MNTMKDTVARHIAELTKSRDTLPQASQDFIWNYGLKQLLADSYVSGKDDTERHALLDKKVAKIMDGTLSIREGGGRESDPEAREITRIAKDLAEQHFKRAGRKIKDVASADMTAKVNEYRAYPKVIATAKANVAAKAELRDL